MQDNKECQPKNAKEEFYERFRGKIPVRLLDVIIVALVAALIAVVVIGMRK